MSMFSKETTKKWIKILLSGPWGSGKTTFLTTMPGPRYWTDAEHSSDHIRDSDDPVLYTTSFADLKNAIAEIKENGNVGSFIIDPYTIFWERLIDHVESETKDGLQFRHWAKIKKPNKRLFTELLNLPCHVGIATHEADVFEMQKNDRGKLEPVKIGVKIDAEKKTGYSPDVVLRLAIEGGVHVGYIEKIRIRKDLAVKTGLVIGARIENPTFDHFRPIMETYASGKAIAHYADDRETSEKDDKVFEQIEDEEEQARKKKVVGQIQRGEKKCQDLKIYGWQDDNQISSTRITAMGTDNLKECAAEDLTAYLQGLKNQVNQYNQQKLQEA